MAFLWGLLTTVGRIVFLRGSPERIYYTRRLFIVTLMLAVAASAGVQKVMFDAHLVFIILRVFAEVTMFMVMMVLLTAKIARFRLARMMLVLVLINFCVDVVLIAAGSLVSYRNVDPLVADYVAFAVSAVAMYGAGNVLAWGLQRPLYFGIGLILLYAVAVVGLDSAFQGLYEVMAA